MSPHCRQLHKCLYRLTHYSQGSEVLRDISLTIDKLTDSSLKITLADEMDPCFLAAVILSRTDYEEMKRSQGLLVDFDTFPSQFMRLLQQCECGNMFLSMHQDNPLSVFLEIVERNDFKKLVHLSIKTTLASDSDIRKNMANNIIDLKNQISNLQSKSISKESSFSEREKFLETRINDLSNLVAKTNDEKLQRENELHSLLKKERDDFDKERFDLKKNIEACFKTQTSSLQEALMKKEKQLDDTMSRCRHLQDTITSLESTLDDKTERIYNLEKQFHNVKLDAETWRNQNGTLDRNYHDKEQTLQQTKSRLVEVEKVLREKSDMLKDTLDTLQAVTREKNALEEKVNINDTLLSKKKLELQNLNEQLLKANQIIAKQNTDILELREKIMCRTAIAFEQEKVINANATEIGGLKQKEAELRDQIDQDKKLHEATLDELETTKKQLDEKSEMIKNNNEIIQWLHKKIDAIQSVNELTTAATTCRTNTSSAPFSDNGDMDAENNMLSNLYVAAPPKSAANSRTRRSNDRSEPSRSDSGERYCVDPVYLKPSHSAAAVGIGRNKSQALKGSLAGLRSTRTTAPLPPVDDEVYPKKNQNGNNRYATGYSSYFPRK